MIYECRFISSDLITNNSYPCIMATLVADDSSRDFSALLLSLGKRAETHFVFRFCQERMQIAVIRRLSTKALDYQPFSVAPLV